MSKASGSGVARVVADKCWRVPQHDRCRGNPCIRSERGAVILREGREDVILEGARPARAPCVKPAGMDYARIVNGQAGHELLAMQSVVDDHRGAEGCAPIG